MKRGKGERIMVVDDEAPVADMIAQYLTLEGFHATRVYQGEEALSKLEEERADVLILDLMMPHMDGYQVLEAIQKKENLQKMSVIILTAKASDEDQLKGWQKGASFYITKPFEMDELADAIVLALEERRRQINEKIYEI